jgi:hypothetical protein
VVNATPRPFYPRQRLSTHCIGGWVGPRASLDMCGNLASPGFDPRTVQAVECRYTDWAIAAHTAMLLVTFMTINSWQCVRSRHATQLSEHISKCASLNVQLSNWTALMLSPPFCWELQMPSLITVIKGKRLQGQPSIGLSLRQATLRYCVSVVAVQIYSHGLQGVSTAVCYLSYIALKCGNWTTFVCIITNSTHRLFLVY